MAVGMMVRITRDLCDHIELTLPPGDFALVLTIDDKFLALCEDGDLLGDPYAMGELIEELPPDVVRENWGFVGIVRGLINMHCKATSPR
jgi:hypothetical protein